jgi:hypothetical protein
MIAMLNNEEIAAWLREERELENAEKEMKS